MTDERIRKIKFEGPCPIPEEYGDIKFGVSLEEFKELVRKSGAEFMYQNPELLDCDKQTSSRRDKLIEFVNSTKGGMQILSNRKFNFKTEYWKSILPKVMEILG